VTADLVRVVDEEMGDVPRDGETPGEVVMRGNIVMAGYFRDPDATAHAFRGGWFHSGDVAVWHPDGAIELRDRMKDIIISGGENVSTIEVEQMVMRHPAVLECAVVSTPDEYWGERPVAYVTPRTGMDVDEAEIIAFCGKHMAHYKCPAAVRVGSCRRRRPARCRSSCSASTSGRAGGADQVGRARAAALARPPLGR